MKHLPHFTTLIFLCAVTYLSKAQDKKELTFKDAVLKGYSSLSPERLNQLQWVKNDDSYTYCYKKAKKQYLLIGSVNSMIEDTLLNLADLNKIMLLPDTVALKSFPAIKWLDKSDFYVNYKNTFYKINVPAKTANRICDYPANGENTDFEETKFNLAYTVDNNLFISTSDGRTLKVTDDSDKGIVNGQIVHRNEFGINKGIFWSPNGNYLAYYRKDETMVTDYPIININERPAKVKMIKYPMAGMTSHEVTLGVYNMATGKSVFLKTGEPKDHYLTCITWDPSEKFIYVATLNRDQNHMWLNKYNSQTGEFVKTLFEETDEKYVEPDHTLVFLKESPDKFIWFSERDGYRHVYLYNTEGKLIRQLTKGKWVVLDVLDVDEKKDQLFVWGTGENPTEKHIYRVNMNNGQYKRLSKESGTHFALVSNLNHYIIDVFSNLNTPRTYKLLDENGKNVKQIFKASNPLNDYKIGNCDIFTINAADNSPLWCRMIKPSEFNKNKKYPVLVYVYNGPRVQLVTNSWLGGSPLWMYYFAEQGYIIFTVDGRGSENRGRDFGQITFRHLGKYEIEDQLKGVEYLKSIPFIDSDKMAVHGWSYGGFMTTSLMVKTPGTFKVGVAGGPVIDWKFYEVMYTERYMDTPKSNPEGYKEASLLNYVDNLKGKLLTIHGTADDVVVMQHNLAFIKKCIDHGIQTDFFVYPGHHHNVRGKDRYHLMQKVLQYIQDNLN